MFSLTCSNCSLVHPSPIPIPLPHRPPRLSRAPPRTEMFTWTSPYKEPLPGMFKLVSLDLTIQGPQPNPGTGWKAGGWPSTERPSCVLFVFFLNCSWKDDQLQNWCWHWFWCKYFWSHYIPNMLLRNWQVPMLIAWSGFTPTLLQFLSTAYVNNCWFYFLANFKRNPVPEFCCSSCGGYRNRVAWNRVTNYWVCSIAPILAVLYRVGVNTSIVLLWETQSRRAWIGTKFRKSSTPLVILTLWGILTSRFFTGQMTSGQTKTYMCDKAVYGRYVTVYIAGNGTLSICEVQVFQAGEHKM